MNREQWLQAAVALFRPYFKQVASVELPPVHVSIGFGVSSPRKTRGECWPRKASADGLHHIFISPRLDQHAALTVLAHELVHVVDDCQHKHTAPFVAIARRVGLEAPFTSAVAGPELITQTDDMLIFLPEYPHSILNIGDPATKKQTTRMLKVIHDECGYTIRLSQKWADQALPDCPLCLLPMGIG